MQEANHNKNGPAKKKTSFFKLAHNLPAPLFQRFLKQFVVSLMIAVISIVLAFYTKQVMYCWGLMFSLYLAYLALSLVWNYYDKKIVCKEMVCIKAAKHLKQRIFLILREMDADEQNPVTHHFYIPASSKDLALITPNTIMRVYYDPKSPVELLGWEIIGNL